MAHPAVVGQPLSPRERQILRAYLECERIKEVAAVLGLSPQTVKNYLHDAYKKLDVTSNLGAFKAMGWIR